MKTKEELFEMEHVRKQIQEAGGTLYAITHGDGFPEVELVEAEPRHRTEKFLVCTDLAEQISSLYGIHRDVNAELQSMRRNPPRPQYKFWSTGGLMNGSDIRFHREHCKLLREKRQAIEQIITDLEHGTYEIRKLK